MANEITVVGRNPRTGNYSLFFRYDITAVTVGGAKPVPSPATPLPTDANPTPTQGDALPWAVRQVITAGEMDALDAGDAVYEVVGFHPADGLTNPQLIARAQEIYAQRKADYLADYADRYDNAGVRVNEV